MVDDIQYRYDEMSAEQQYVLSLHWSMSQLALGSIEVSATNSCERLFSIFMLTLGLLCSSAVGAFFASQLLEMVYVFEWAQETNGNAASVSPTDAGTCRDLCRSEPTYRETEAGQSDAVRT